MKDLIKILFFIFLFSSPLKAEKYFWKEPINPEIIYKCTENDFSYVVGFSEVKFLADGKKHWLKHYKTLVGWAPPDSVLIRPTKKLIDSNLRYHYFSVEKRNSLLKKDEKIIELFYDLISLNHTDLRSQLNKNIEIQSNGILLNSDHIHFPVLEVAIINSKKLILSKNQKQYESELEKIHKTIYSIRTTISQNSSNYEIYNFVNKCTRVN